MSPEGVTPMDWELEIGRFRMIENLFIGKPSLAACLFTDFQ